MDLSCFYGSQYFDVPCTCSIKISSGCRFSFRFHLGSSIIAICEVLYLTIGNFFIRFQIRNLIYMLALVSGAYCTFFVIMVNCIHVLVFTTFQFLGQMESPGADFSPDTLAFMELALEQVMLRLSHYVQTHWICFQDFEFNWIHREKDILILQQMTYISCNFFLLP